MNLKAKIIILITASLFIALASFFYLQSYSTIFFDKQSMITQIMNYPMTDVVKRCQKDFGYTDEDMAILEPELKKYLALSLVTSKEDLGTGMYSSDVDNLWHSFILFTREYADFCHNYIGFFVHHVPEIDTNNSSLEKRQESAKDFKAFMENYEKTFQEEIHPIWFLDMYKD